MPDLPKALAVLGSDLHLQHKPPACRADEPDWYEAMGRTLDEVSRLCADLGGVPFVLAGDVFNHWNSPPELIAFAMRRLPAKVFAVPGQHDLPYHNYADLRRSAYGVLVEAGRIIDLHPDFTHYHIPGVAIRAFPWGYPVSPAYETMSNDKHKLTLAVVHAYVWREGHGHQDAPETAHVSYFHQCLAGYDVALFGDNHQGFQVHRAKLTLWNNGTLMRRTTAERPYQPGVGVLYEDGTVVRHILDTTQDVLTADNHSTEVMVELLDLRDFITDLEELAEDPVEFCEAVRHAIQARKLGPRASQILLEAIGDGKPK